MTMILIVLDSDHINVHELQIAVKYIMAYLDLQLSYTYILGLAPLGVLWQPHHNIIVQNVIIS